MRRAGRSPPRLDARRQCFHLRVGQRPALVRGKGRHGCSRPSFADHAEQHRVGDDGQKDRIVERRRRAELCRRPRGSRRSFAGTARRSRRPDPPRRVCPRAWVCREDRSQARGAARASTAAAVRSWVAPAVLLSFGFCSRSILTRSRDEISHVGPGRDPRAGCRPSPSGPRRPPRPPRTRIARRRTRASRPVAGAEG